MDFIGKAQQQIQMSTNTNSKYFVQKATIVCSWLFIVLETFKIHAYRNKGFSIYILSIL